MAQGRQQGLLLPLAQIPHQGLKPAAVERLGPGPLLEQGLAQTKPEVVVTHHGGRRQEWEALEA
jgi:hypothetical protein